MQNSGRVKTRATVRIRMKLHQNDATDDLYISSILSYTVGISCMKGEYKCYQIDKVIFSIDR